jgi:hypothetical protein
VNLPSGPRSKVQVCRHSLAAIACSNPAGGIDVLLLCVLCVFRERPLCRAVHLSRGVLPNVVCLSLTVKPR